MITNLWTEGSIAYGEFASAVKPGAFISCESFVEPHSEPHSCSAGWRL